jgi:hypothetical protein
MVRLRKTLSLFVIILLALQINSYSQTGPGGVGSSTSNLVWLEADSLAGLTDGEAITTWSDGSGNNLDFSQPDPAYKPIYKANILNNKPVVRFDKTNGRIRRTAFANFPTTAITTFLVNKNAENGDGVLSYASTGSNNDFLIFNSSSLNLYRGVNRNSGIAINNNSWHIVDASWRSSDGAMAFWIDGSESYTNTLQTGTSITQNGCLAIAGEQDAIDGSYDAGQAHTGDFAEVIVYNIYLNKAQRIIVTNYLAAKYSLDISLSGNKYYSYQADHGNDVAGIGREDATNTHTSAMSSGILQISNPSALDADKEYMLFGHDDDSLTSWTTIEAPNSGTNIQRLAREWRFEETGDLGTITFTIDSTLLPARPSGYSKFVLLVDADGDFSSGASVYEMLSPGTNEFFDLPGYNINSGDYVAIGTVVPTIEFSDSSPEEFETTNGILDIVLNYISQTNVNVDYFTTDFTAISPGDYTAVPLTTKTISAGSQSTSITITLINDGAVENDETFTITLTNQPADINIGPDNPVSFTIHDDDNTRKIYYSAATSSDNENAGTVQIQVQITPSEFDPVNPTTVDYQVTGGTANGGGEDFTLASGTLLIPPLTISNTFDIIIIDDSYDEPDETIVISLSNPTNSSLSDVDPIVHTFTILDNDNPPQVQFGSATSNGNESTVSVSIPVEISALSQSNVVVDYTVTGTATSGPDHNLINGSVTIPAGSLSATIDFTVNDDSEIESHETVIITMTDPPLNAVLGRRSWRLYL